MAIRTLTTIISDMIAFIVSKRPSAATFSGTVLRDVVIESPATEMSAIYTEVERTQKLSSLNYATDLTTSELDAIAANFMLVRLVGTPASGTITFRLRNFTFTSSTIVVPVGTVVSTIGTNTSPQISFVTTATVTFQPALAPTYFNPTSGLYEQTTSITAQTIGAATNVAAGTIVRLTSSVSGVDSVVNSTATTGGTDTESNTDIAARLKIKLSGNNVGTKTGILSLVESNSNVRDAIVVTTNDPEMQRDQFGGEVDVYILGTALTTISDTILFDGSEDDFILARQPVSSIASVTGLVSGSAYTFLAGTDYTFVKDVTPLITGSTQEQSYVHFTGATLPDVNSQFVVTYVYDGLIEALQTQLNREDTHIVTADVLVRQAAEATIDVSADITIFSGFTAANVVFDVQTALTNFINDLGLGKSINRSDIIAVVEGVEGVDSVDTETLALFKNAVLVPPTTQRLVIFKTEYAVTGSLTISVI